jgi:hypothetical protein
MDALSALIVSWASGKAPGCVHSLADEEIAFIALLTAPGHSTPAPVTPWLGAWRIDDSPPVSSAAAALLATTLSRPPAIVRPPYMPTVGFGEVASAREALEDKAAVVAGIVAELLAAPPPSASAPPPTPPVCAWCVASHSGSPIPPHVPLLDRLWTTIGGWRGMVLLAGCRVTVGTLPLLPPPLTTLLASFNTLYTDPPPAAGGARDGISAAPPLAAGGAGAGDATAAVDAATAAVAASGGAGDRPAPARAYAPKPKPPAQPLTVGARAHAKHAHRDSTGWWGSASGTVAARNASAEACIRRILAGAVWVNVHAMVHDTPLLEVRVASGHGARWSADGTFFRGFLEPPMAGGHAAGWVH